MAYVDPNFKTKKALKEHVDSGLFDVHVYEPGLGSIPRDGTISLEGPHFPEPHRWYAKGTMKDGKLVKVS